MTITSKLVSALSPANPNIEPGTDVIPISPIALWPISIIPSVHDLPGLLDLDRLEKAISEATAIWPTIAGRYHWDGDQKFEIRLTASSVPVDSQIIYGDTVFPTRNVNQPSLEPFLTPLHPEYHMPNSDHPLLAIRLTILAPSNRCLLGISWAHILGDAFACNLSIRHLAWLYLKSGQEPNFDQPPLPTFFPHVKLPIDSFYPASADLERYKIHQITPSYPAAIASGMYKHNRLDSDGVLVSLTRKELEGMMREFKELAGDNGGQLSSLDVITGWWIGVLQRIGVEIHRVIYTINYRTLYRSSDHFPSNLPTLASNVAQMLAIPLPAQQTSPISTAQAIRKKLQELRSDEEEGLIWLSCIADSLKDAAQRGEGQLVLPIDGEVLVNSNLRFNWNIPFGFPSDQTAYYTSGTGLHVLRVSEANPLPGEKFGETNVELAFRVRKGTTELTEGIIKADKGRWV